MGIDREINDVTCRTPLKRDQAYAMIRRAIIRLDLQPGSLIDETALSQQLGLGRTPIREALQRLMHEGLVAVFPRRGMMVAPISLMDAQHLNQARLVCEPNIARLAAHVGNADAWDEMERVLAESPSVHTCTDDVARGADVNERFHIGIAAATGNPYLVELVAGCLRRRARLSFLFFRHGVYDPVVQQHYDILAHLRTGDGDGAAALMEKHILVTRDRDTRVFTEGRGAGEGRQWQH